MITLFLLASVFPSVQAARPQQKQNIKGKAASTRNETSVTTQSATNPDEKEDDGEDPDLPAVIGGDIDKEAYHAARNEQISLLRGIEPGKPFDPAARIRAIEHMNAVRNNPASPQSIATTWTQIGPAPIPNGQTQTTTTAVSGRTTCIAVDPTNSNNIYVGTAQGGLYRSLDGGTTWLAIFDTAQSLAIGALAFVPGDPTTLYVGTGEANGSADSFAGVGLYRINNATTSPLLTGPMNPIRNYIDADGITPRSAPIFNGRSISAILVHPTIPGSLLVSVAGGVIGLGGDAPFGNTIPPLGMRGMYRLANANGPAAGVTGERIKVTSAPAAGTCFDSPCTGNRNVNDMVYDKTDATGNTVVVWMNGLNAAGDGGIYRTTNAWASPATSVAFTQTFITTATSTSNARGSFASYLQGGSMVIYAANGEPGTGTICNSGSGAIRRSTDGGLTWSAKLPGGGGFCGGQCFYNIGVAVTPGATTATDTVYIAGNVRSTSCSKLLGKSLDGGNTTFTNLDVGLHADTHLVAIDPSNANIIYHGSDGGIYKSTDAAATWTSLNNTGFHATQFQSIAVHPTDRYFTIGGTQDNGTNKMTTSFTWIRSDSGDGGFALIDQNAVDTTNVTMYHTYFNSSGSLLAFARSTNAGVSWPSVLGCNGGVSNNGINCTDAVNFYAPMTLGPGGPNTVYYGSDRLYRSTDTGTTMSVVSQAPLTASVPISAIGVFKGSDNVRMVGQNNGAIWFTTSGSSVLTSLDPVGAGSVIPDKYVTRCVFDPSDANTVYVTLAGYTGGTTPAQSHVWRITNLSTIPVRTAINNGLPDVPVNAFVIDPLNTTHLFAGTDIAVYASTDTGATWAPFGSGLPVVSVFDMAIAQPNTAGEFLRIATHGRGMWEISLGPTIARVIDTQATSYDDGRVLLQWQTGNEVNNLGFNVYREQDGQRVRITPQLIAGSALMTGPGPSLEAGHSYRWSDLPVGVSRKLRYWIEDIDLSGTSSWTGPIQARLEPGKRQGPGRNAMLLSSLGLHSAQLNGGSGTTPVQQVAEAPRFSLAAIQQQNVLASQAAVKIAVKQEGWYRITQAELAGAGLVSIPDPAKLQLFVDGSELPMKVVTDSSGKLSAIEFYGLGLDTAVTDTRVYWLVSGAQPGKRISTVSAKGLSAGGSSFAYSVERKDRTVYFSSLRNGEAENFFGPVVTRDGVSQTITLTHIAAGAANAAVEVSLQGVTRVGHQVQVKLNGATAGNVTFKDQGRGVAQFNVDSSLLREGDNVVQLVSQGGDQDVNLLDAIRITYQHSFNADGDHLQLTTTAGQFVTIDGFSNAAIRAIDATEGNNPQELSGTIRPGKNGFSITIAAGGTGLRRLLAFADPSVKQAASVWANQPSSWRKSDNAADLIVLTRRNWFGSIEPLKSLRQSQGLSVAMVDAEDVFDEFNFGNKTPQSVKDFILYARNSWKKAPRYLLIVGDSSYDPKNYLGFGDNDIVLTKLIDTQFMETASDDWLADSNMDGIPEIAIGRLPARTLTEVSRMVAKIVGYNNTTTDSSVLLVSDSNDGYNFEAVTSHLRKLIPADMKVDEIDRGRLDPAIAKAQLLDAINRGERLVSYTGHGNLTQWRGNLLNSDDARALENGRNLPLFITMTCLNGYFQDVVLDSLAESLMKAERGGAVAVWASSGMTPASGQELLNQEMFRAIFDRSSGPLSLGEAAIRAKALTSDLDIRRTWILFGDPSMNLR